MIRSAEDEGIALPRSFLLFFILGFVLVFVGVTVVIVATVLYGGGSASIGAVIFVGPFPIVVGVGPEATLLVLFGIILAVLSVIVFLVMRIRVGGSGG